MALAVPAQWTDTEGDQDSEILVSCSTGDWLAAIVVSRTVDGSAPTLAIGDVARNGWRLVADDFRFASSSYQVSTSQNVQAEIWACPAVRFDGWPWLLVYASAMQITASDVGSLLVDVIKVTGINGPDLAVDSVTLATATAANSITLTAPAPAGGANCLFLAAAAGDIAYGSYTTTGTGWTQLTNVVRSGPELGLFGAWREGTTGSSVTFSLAGGFFRNWAGVIVGLRTAGSAPSQPNPAWAATRLQIGLGYDLSTPLSRVRFTDQTKRYLSLPGSTRGIQAERGRAQQGQTVLGIANDDGAYTARPVAAAASANAAGTTTTIKIADANATAIHAADFFRLKTSVGALKELNVFQVVSLASAGGTTTVTFKRADGTAGGALASTASGDVYAGILIDLYIPWRLLKTVAGTTYVTASGWLRDIAVTFTDAHWSEIQAQGADAIETLTAANPSALQGEIFRRPGLYAYWPCNDGSSGTYATNASGTSTAVLTQTTSKYGTGNMTAAFGATTQDVQGANNVVDSLFGDAGSGWAQTGGTAADLITKGFALVGSDPGFPAISGGVTIFGAVMATDLNAITNATADPTVCIIRNTDPGAGVGQGSVIKLSIDRATLKPRVTVWDKTTHAATSTLGGPFQIAGGSWTTWALTFDQGSFALYLGANGLVASGSCNLVASWSGIDIGGEADAFTHGRTFPGIHAHIAVYARRLTAQEATNLGTAATLGYPLEETTAGRATRKLNTVAWRGTRVVTSSVVFDSIEDVPSGSMVDFLSDLTSWEDGLTFADAANQLQVRGHVMGYQQRPRAVLGDGPGELPFEEGQQYGYNPTYVYDQTSITNTSISGNNVGASTFVAVDDAASSRYNVRTLELATRLAHNSDAWHLGWWLLALYAAARMRVETITVSAAAAGDTASSTGRWAFVCGVEVGDIVTVNRRPPGQPMISVRCRVLSVTPAFSFSSESSVMAQVTLTLAAAPFVVPIANDAVYGTVGGTVLGA